VKVYSPSSTLMFQRCPQLWWWKQQNWESQTIGNADCAAAVGIGFGKGMELYHKALEWSTAGLERVIDTSVSAGLQRLEARIAAGASLLPRVEATYNLIPQRIEKAIRGFHKKKPLPEDWCDFLTERTFPDYGNCRIDMLCRSDLGPCIVDFKSKVTAQAYRIDDFLFDAETSWQMMHYVWAARQLGLNVDSYAIVLVTIEPLQFFVEQWVVDEERIARWALDAVRWWHQMEVTETCALVIGATRVGNHRDQYGLCSHYGLCYGRPENYTQIERAA